MTAWLYLASSEKASLAATLGTIVGSHFLWRSARNERGGLISNVGNIAIGDMLVVAWRHSGGRRTAYLRCTVAAPRTPANSQLVIDRLTGPDSSELIAAGYPESSSGTVEGIRLDEIAECYFNLQGRYGGNNALHRLADIDLPAAAQNSEIPPDALLEAHAARPTAAVRTDASEVQTSIDSIEVTANAATRAFDAYAMVDWSSSSTPVRGNNSIWIASGAWEGSRFSAGQPINVSTRVEASAHLTRQLQQWTREGRRVLLGLDFAFGYPSGFAAALGLPATQPAWREIHSFFAANVTDSETNLHNRDAFAELCNKRIGAPGPFWGCSSAGTE